MKINMNNITLNSIKTTVTYTYLYKYYNPKQHKDYSYIHIFI
jgi:hypothetical protein